MNEIMSEGVEKDGKKKRSMNQVMKGRKKKR